MHVTCMSRAPGESKGSGPQAAAGGAKAVTVEEHGRTEAVNFALSDLRSVKEVSKGKRYVVQTNRLAAVNQLVFEVLGYPNVYTQDSACLGSPTVRYIIQYVHFCPQFFKGITIVMNIINLEGSNTVRNGLLTYSTVECRAVSRGGGGGGSGGSAEPTYVNHFVPPYLALWLDCMGISLWDWPISL